MVQLSEFLLMLGVREKSFAVHKTEGYISPEE